MNDSGERYRAMLSNGVLIHYPDPKGEAAELTLRVTKDELLRVLTTGQLDGVDHQGDAGVLDRLMSVLDEPRPDFAIVTP